MFLPALEEGVLPLLRDGEPCDLAEEARLLYVGMTRARRLLVLSHAERRTVYGAQLERRPSRLLARLPQGGVRRTVLAPKTLVRQKQGSLLG